MLEVITQYLITSKPGSATLRNGDIDSPLSRPASNSRGNTFKSGLEPTNHAKIPYPTKVIKQRIFFNLSTKSNI